MFFYSVINTTTAKIIYFFNEIKLSLINYSYAELFMETDGRADRNDVESKSQYMYIGKERNTVVHQ